MQENEIYNFEGDKVTSVLSFVKTDTIETAEELKKAYLENLNHVTNILKNFF